MSKQTINIGTKADDGTGDTLRNAFTKTNQNFTEVFTLAQNAYNVANTGTNTGANTGNVTFSDQIVIGTGISNLVSGLYLAPSSSSANALQYLRVRGDTMYEPTHIHFDTGNNQYFNQFIGDDNKYVLLSNTGSIVINTDDYAGNTAQWTFAANSDLYLPTSGGLVFDRADTTIRVGMGFHIASGEGISLDAIDQNAILTLTGAGNGNVNQTYNRTTNTLYTGNDNSSVTVENIGGTWYVLIAGDSKYTSNDLLGWALSTGPGPVPVGVLSNGYKSWGFNPDGILTLPAGGAITNSDGFTLNAGGHGTITIGKFIETPGVDEHFHIAFPASNDQAPYQDLYLGDDFNFVKVRGNHNAIDHGVDIGANNRYGGSQQIWNFGTDGALTFPDSTVQTTAATPGFKNTILIDTVSHVAANTEEVILCDPNAAGGNIAVSLSDSVNDGKIFTIKNINPGGYSVNVGATTIEDPTTKSFVSEVIMANTGEVYTWVSHSGVYRHIG